MREYNFDSLKNAKKIMKWANRESNVIGNMSFLLLFTYIRFVWKVNALAGNVSSDFSGLGFSVSFITLYS